MKKKKKRKYIHVTKYNKNKKKGKASLPTPPKSKTFFLNTGRKISTYEKSINNQPKYTEEKGRELV